MRVIRDVADVRPHEQNAVLGIGNFDGVHRGHQLIIHEVVRLAKEHRTKAAILTFEPPPSQLFKPEIGSQRIMSVRQKMEMFAQMGIDLMIAQRFNRAFSDLTAHEFMESYLVQGLRAKAVITGSEFCFGTKRGGDAAMLKACSAFDYYPIAPLVYDATSKVSSSQIREAIKAGDMEKIVPLLGRPYRWSARVTHGDKRGRTIGFPTANLVSPRILLPRFGVYAVRARAQGADEWMGAVANVGVRPTFGVNAPLMEVHLLNREMDVYGKRLEVELIKYLRDEQRFDGIDALKVQLKRDCQLAQEVLNLCA